MKILPIPKIIKIHNLSSFPDPSIFACCIILFITMKENFCSYDPPLFFWHFLLIKSRSLKLDFLVFAYFFLVGFVVVVFVFISSHTVKDKIFRHSSLSWCQSRKNRHFEYANSENIFFTSVSYLYKPMYYKHYNVSIQPIHFIFWTWFQLNLFCVA